MGLASKLAAAQGGAPPGGAYGGAPPPASYQQQQQQQGAPKPGGYSADVDMQNSLAKRSTKLINL
ncbi:hypothetical protein KCU82_g13367, partial [Aureobasidium melanogenum]